MKRATKKSDRAERGARQAEAVEIIKGFEAKQLDWDWTTLSEAMGISVQHARNVMEALTLKGVLQHDMATVRKRRLVLVADVAQAA